MTLKRLFRLCHLEPAKSSLALFIELKGDDLYLLHESRHPTDINDLGFTFHGNKQTIEHVPTLSTPMPVQSATIFRHMNSFSALAPLNPFIRCLRYLLHLLVPHLQPPQPDQRGNGVSSGHGWIHVDSDDGA